MLAIFWLKTFRGALYQVRMVMPFDCSNLASEWDGHEDIRGRLRCGKRLVALADKSRDATIAQCVGNMDILPPLLHRLYASALKQPSIEGLREQCGEAYCLSSRTPLEDDVESDAKEMKKMLLFIKRKANRSDVSMETLFCELSIFFYRTKLFLYVFV